MPVIIVHGMPALPSEPLLRLITAVKVAVVGVTELGVKTEHVSVFFPVDRCTVGLGEELIVMVRGLVAKPERTPEVRQKLALAVRDRLKQFIEDCRTEAWTRMFPGAPTVAHCGLIKVFVEPFDPDNGYADSRHG